MYPYRGHGHQPFRRALRDCGRPRQGLLGDDHLLRREPELQLRPAHQQSAGLHQGGLLRLCGRVHPAGLFPGIPPENWSQAYKEFTVLVTRGDIYSSAATDEVRRVSTRGLELISDYEGSVPEITDDALAAGNPTVGHGYVVQVNTAFYNNLNKSELFAQLVEIANATFSPAVERFRKNYGIRMNPGPVRRPDQLCVQLRRGDPGPLLRLLPGPAQRSGSLLPHRRQAGERHPQRERRRRLLQRQPLQPGGGKPWPGERGHRVRLPGLPQRHPAGRSGTM